MSSPADPLNRDGYQAREPLERDEDGKPVNVPYPFCLTPERCAGHTCCPRSYSCSE